MYTSGLYHEGLLLQAAESTRDPIPGVDGEGMSNEVRIKKILGFPEITHPDAHYQKKIQVMFRMLEMISDEWRPDVISILRSRDEAYSSILYTGGDGWELLVDMIEPNNILAFKDNAGLQFEESLSVHLKKNRDGEDIFGKNGLELLMPTYKGWKLPIIGLKKLYGFHLGKKTAYTKDQILVEESDIGQLFESHSKRIFQFDNLDRVVDNSR